MIRVKKLSLTACFMLATILTFSCSSDKDGDNGSISGLPDVLSSGVQVYSDGEKFTGSGDVAMFFDNFRQHHCDAPDCDLLSGDVTSSTQWTCTDYNGKAVECTQEQLYDNIPAGKIKDGQLLLNVPANVDKYLQPWDGLFLTKPIVMATIADSKKCYLDLKAGDKYLSIAYVSKDGQKGWIIFNDNVTVYNGEGTLAWDMDCHNQD